MNNLYSTIVFVVAFHLFTLASMQIVARLLEATHAIVNKHDIKISFNHVVRLYTMAFALVLLGIKLT